MKIHTKIRIFLWNYKDYEDHPIKYDAWEIEDHHQYKSWTLDDAAVITPVIYGSRAGFVIERKYMHSTIKQTLWLRSFRIGELLLRC